jgi:hypothetical protein
MSDWKSIETAPKDGTAMILGFWYQGRFAQYMGFYDPAGWMESSRRFFPSHMQSWFTDWHPLPAPPTQEAGGQT